MVYIHEHRNQLERQYTGIRTDTVSQHIRDTAMKDSQAREPQRFCVNLDSLDEIPSKHEILHVWQLNGITSYFTYTFMVSFRLYPLMEIYSFG